MATEQLTVQELDRETLDNLANVSLEEVYATLKSTSRGLDSEAVAQRKTAFGLNAIKETKGQPLILKFLSNFVHLMALLLWAAGIIALVAKMPQLAIACWMVNLINGCFSFWQEFRAGTVGRFDSIFDLVFVCRSVDDETVTVQLFAFGRHFLSENGFDDDFHNFVLSI